MFNRICAMLCVLALVVAPFAVGQNANKSLLPVDSIDLYRFFFQFHDQFANAMDQQKAANPNASARIDNGAGALFRISQPDLAKLRAISKQVAKDMDGIDTDRKTHANAQAKKELGPDPSVLKQLDARRQASITSAISRLKNELQPSSWAGLSSFINDQYRQSITVIEVNAK